MSSPCQTCFTRGIVYSEENCKNCDYEIAMKLLKGVLLIQDGCYVHCKNCKGYDDFQCPECDKEKECTNRSLYEVDFNKVAKDYEIEL